MDWMNAVIQGVLLGGLYALFAAGLSLVFGIMRVVNLAHGDFIILAAFLSVVVVGVTGLGPFLSLVIVVPLMGGLGYAVQRGLLARTLDRGVLPPLLVTFGLSVIIQNLLLQIFSADDRRLDAGGISTASIGIAGQLAIGWFPVVVFLVGVLAIAGLQILFTRTALGRAFRATADDQETVCLMGIDNRHTYGLAVALAFGIVALAGVCLGIRTTFSPDIGPGRLLVAFETVVIGGLGSLWGTLMGGLMVEFLSMLTLAQMWNLLAGYGGLVSVGQQAYVGLGGYALIVLADFLDVNPFVSVFLAGFVTAAFALPTAAVVFRFQGGYFAVGTWVVAEVYYLLVANSSALGGGLGRSLQAIRGIARAERERLTYWVALVVGVGAVALVYVLLRSRRGLALTAIRDSARASESLGINVFRSKLFVYVVAAFGCGVAGALIYLNLLRILPTAAFSVNWTASMIFVVVIGGIGTLEGPLVGTTVYFVLREFLADYGAWYTVVPTR